MTVNLTIGTCWRLWNIYHAEHTGHTPPLMFLKPGASTSEAFMVSSATPKQLRDFIAAHEHHPELSFKEASDWLLPARQWFGEWTVFVCRPKAPVFTPRRKTWRN